MSEFSLPPVIEHAATCLAGFGIATVGDLACVSPIDGSEIATVRQTSSAQFESAISQAQTAFPIWREVPAPKRGMLVQLFGDQLQRNKDLLAQLVAIECGKPISEAQGEVQEMIDICAFAVGLSRQLYGLTIASERPKHRMMESWHPLGPVGVISAFNFPVAVWSWNAMLALVCGNPVIWKPSEKTPLCALAVQSLFEKAAAEFGEAAPPALSQVLIGGTEIGRMLTDDTRVPLISATGSTRMGRIVGERVAKRFGRSLLELGGNNATIIAPSADLSLAINACAFGFMGTTGQRCTSLRRLFVHASLYEVVVGQLKTAVAAARIGDPRDPAMHIGPLIDEEAYEAMTSTLSAARVGGAEVTGGGRLDRAGVYVRPALVEPSGHEGHVLEETFAPILNVLPYHDIDEAIAKQNAVKQGLSSSIFTNDMREAERFLSASGSDCGIANVNIGTSGAEIGGAFGGEKETGGGRESGSDSWKAYMRRQTSTINYGSDLPLAQGVTFEL